MPDDAVGCAEPPVAPAGPRAPADGVEAPPPAPPESAPPATQRFSRAGGALLLSVFLISGASGLVYQVVWSRALTLVFGSTTQGVATVLAAFMGGLALGSWLASRIGDRVARPLRAYGFLETGIALFSLSVLLLLPFLDTAYRAIYPVVHLSLPGLTLVRFLLASAFLLPATTLMGATLPILSAYFERRGRVEGQGASILYAVNTVGAVAGTALAGFWLLPALGMAGASILAAAGNLAAALGALVLSRKAEAGGLEIEIPFADHDGREQRSSAGQAASLEGGPAPGLGSARAGPLPQGARDAVAAAICVSGAGALILEVVWTRTLSMVLGSSTQAFTVMLTTFLVGLAAGSAAAGRLLGRLRNPLAAFAITELAVGLTVFAGVFVFPELPYSFLQIFRATAEAPLWFNAGRFLLAATVMLPPTFLLGAVFPLAVRCWRMGAEEAARPVGLLYAVNTLGAIAGSLAAGFLLVPTIGLRQTLVTGALVNLGVGAFLVAVSPSERRGFRFGLAGAVLVLMPMLPLGAPHWNPLLMTSGVFQYAPHYAQQFPTRRAFREFHEEHRQLYYRDGPTTTVTVEKRPYRSEGRPWLVLTVNGKVDASSVADMESQVLVGQLPILTGADPRRILVIGWGSGVTAGSILTHRRVESVRAVEIEPAVIEASRFFEEFNHNPYADPRLSIEINDARHALLVDDSTYDAIVSEPSNPWLSGPSRLFTREFFLLAKERLAPGGILCQWVQLYGLDPASYWTVIRTLHEVFPHVTILKGSSGDTLVMASASPIRFDVGAIAARMREPEVAADLARVRVTSAASLLSRFRVGGGSVRKMAGEGPLNTDDNALIEFAAWKNLYRNTDRENDVVLAAAASSPIDQADFGGVPAEEAARFPVLLAREYLKIGLAARAKRIMTRLESEPPSPSMAAEAAAFRGDLLTKEGKAAEARGAWEEAIRIDPACLPALMSLGRRILDEDHQPAAAADLFRRALETHPAEAEPRIALGRALLAAGRPREAVAVFEAGASLEIPPSQAPFFHLHWGRACLAEAENECAVREITRYFREWLTAPRPAEVSAEAALDLGRAHLALGRRSLALEQFKIANDLSASVAAWHREQAEEALAGGSAETAVEHLRSAIEWQAGDPRGYHRLGGLLMSRERWSDAHEVWSRLLQRQPADQIALGGAAEALKQMGRLREAVPLLEMMIDLEEDPDRMIELRGALEKARASP